MTRLCFFDCETFSPTEIKFGTHKYAEKAEIMVYAWAFDKEPVTVYDATLGDPFPAELNEAFYDKQTTFVIHNSQFDRVLLEYAAEIKIPVERIHDTLVQARTLGLPGALGTLCDIMKIPADKAKDKKGKQLINLFCKPRPQNSLLRRATHETHPVEWKQFLDYAKLDIEAMRELYNRLPRWNYCGSELALWHLDQKINDKGCFIDTRLVSAAIEAVTKTTAKLNAATRDATWGLVGAASQRDQLLRFVLGVYGVALPDMKADTLERRMNDPELPTAVRELLAIRLQVCTTSTAKYKTLENCVNYDGRLRGTLEFCGAARTGRWAGRKFQPQNLPSRNLLPQKDIEMGIECLKKGIADIVFDNVMELTSSCIRGAIIAPEGKKLVVSDLSNIEGRMAAWLAGEEWLLEAFRALDRGEGHDLYRLEYAKAFNIPVDQVDGGKSKGPQRQIGKVLTLFMQYEGGVGAFITGAVTYGIDLDQMAQAAWDSIPPRIKAEASQAWNWAEKQKRTFELKKETYIVCDSLKRMWREAHPAIASYWGELSAAAINAIQNSGRDFQCRKINIRRNGNWLRVILPSSRSLCYAAPMVDEGKIKYMGINQYSRKWASIGTYGGKLLENITQAASRDIMGHNMPVVNASGYEIVLTVHDELVTESYDDPSFNAGSLSELLATNPPWAAGLPLAAGGFEAYRYRKDE